MASVMVVPPKSPGPRGSGDRLLQFPRLGKLAIQFGEQPLHLLLKRLIDQLADGRLLGLALEIRPPGLLWYPEDVFGPIFVGVFGIDSLLWRPGAAGASPRTSRRCISGRSVPGRRACTPPHPCRLVSLSAASHSLASNPRFAPLPLPLRLLATFLLPISTDSVSASGVTIFPSSTAAF